MKQKTFFGRLQSRKLSPEKKKILDQNLQNLLFHPDKIKNEAFQLFCLGWSLRKIAREKDVSFNTVRDWKNKENWSDKKEKIEAVELYALKT